MRKGTIKTVAGNGKDCCYSDGKLATQVSLSWVVALAVNPRGDLLIAEWEQILKVDAHTGIVSTVAGTGKSGDTEGLPARSASFGQIGGLGVDSAGNLFISDDGQHKVFKVDAANGIVSKVAGNGKGGFSGDGGPAVDASFLFSESLALDGAGNIFVADSENCRFRRIDFKTGVVDRLLRLAGPIRTAPRSQDTSRGSPLRPIQQSISRATSTSFRGLRMLSPKWVPTRKNNRLLREPVREVLAEMVARQPRRNSQILPGWLWIQRATSSSPSL